MSVFQLQKKDYTFPHASQANADGLLAVGGDLNPERLIYAYANGIFPWSDSDKTILWWSPDPRMVMFPEDFKISASLKQKIKSGKFTIKFDTQFDKIIENCAQTPRKHEDSTWITAKMKKAYGKLHQIGVAHSIETFFEDNLVGGLYGVSIGNIFFGESMFHTLSDASKVAFAALIDFAKSNDFSLVDCQMNTKHLESLGAREIPRSKFLKIISESIAKPSIIGKWPDRVQNINLFK